MAIAKMCDRCKKVYEARSIKTLMGFPWNDPIDKVVVITVSREPEKEFDLCDDCLNLFHEKFMKGIDFVEVSQQESDD